MASWVVGTQLEKAPELGSKPVKLNVKLSKDPPVSDTLITGLREMYQSGEFSDVKIVCANQTFRAHRAVLAAQSEVFKHGLARQQDQPLNEEPEVRLADVANPEAVRIMLDFLYQVNDAGWKDYNPRTQEINKDVLRLSQNFKLPGLARLAERFLAQDLTTGNVVERLTICEDFQLTDLRERVLDQLTCNKAALAEVAHSSQITWFPQLMQSILQRAAVVPNDADLSPAKGKRPKAKKQEEEGTNKKKCKKGL